MPKQYRDSEGKVRSYVDAFVSGGGLELAENAEVLAVVKGSRYSEGLLTDRPAADAVEPGTMYFSVDTGALDYSDGSVWAPVP